MKETDPGSTQGAQERTWTGFLLTITLVAVVTAISCVAVQRLVRGSADPILTAGVVGGITGVIAVRLIPRRKQQP